jgi:hypothetical protein
MNRKIPPDAFELYVSMGPERSYQEVAERCGVSKRAVQSCADREEWTERLARIEQQAREQSDKRLAEALEDIRSRHLKTLRAMNGRALEALKGYPITSGMDAIRAAEMVIKLERLIVGDPTDRNAVTLESTVRREYERWLVREDTGPTEHRDESSADDTREESGEGDHGDE